MLNRSIGYRIRPSWIWAYDHFGRVGLVFGLVHDGIAGVPGILRLSIYNQQGGLIASGTIDPGYPVPQKVRQARIILPAGLSWEGMRLKAELVVKGGIHPVQWTCREMLNPDGTLTLRRNKFF